MDTSAIRKHFPSLNRMVNNQQVIYLDGPAGTQVPMQVIDAISGYYRKSNANSHGHFQSSRESDDLLMRTREKIATFLGAPSPHCISFGQNMTTLNFSLSKALARTMEPGDEIFITQLDHESNRGPWLTLEGQGIITKEIKLQTDGTLDLIDFESQISEKTKLVCIGYASNILGTVNDIAKVRKITQKVGALLLVDAVHYAPHLPIDVQEIDCDFLLCSAYKFYGPHVGILYAKQGLLDQLVCDNLRVQEQIAPYKIETGTLNHAAIAGVEAALDFMTAWGDGSDIRARLKDAFNQLHDHEMSLIRALAAGLTSVDHIDMYGPDVMLDSRAPTISFTHDHHAALQICEQLGANAINAWDGHFYAIRTTEILGLLDRGGVTRMGISVYNTLDEIERTVEVVRKITE